MGFLANAILRLLLELRFLLTFYCFTLTFGITDIPGTIVYLLVSIASVNTIFTGILCTIFTKLPTAFSGGNKLDFAPEILCMLSTFPLKILSGYVSSFISTFCPFLIYLN